VTLRPTAGGVVRFAYAGSDDMDAAVASQPIAVTSTVSARLWSRAVRAGHTVRLSGRMAPNLTGFVVYRELFSHGAWRVVATTRTITNGRYSFAIRPTVRGHLTYRIVVAARGKLASGVSVTARL